MWRKARLHPREHLLPPGKIVHCRCSVKRRVQVPRETRYTTCRQKIIRKGSAFHRISVQVISHQWVDQPPRCPISERTGPQSKAPLQGGNEPLPPLCQNGSPARRSIAFHDSPKRCVLFQNVPPTPHFTEWVSILERPLSGGLKSGRQRSQRSFTRWLINGCISAGSVPNFGEAPAVLPGCWAPCWRSQQYVVGLHFAGGGNFVKVRKIERRLVF